MYVGSGHLRTCNTKQKKNTFNDSAQQDQPLYGSGKYNNLSFILEPSPKGLISSDYWEKYWFQETLHFRSCIAMIFDRKKQNLKTFKPFSVHDSKNTGLIIYEKTSQ